MSETKPYNLKLKEFVFLIFQSNPLELQSIQNFCQRSERERERNKKTKKEEKRERKIQKKTSREKARKREANIE
jgi:hypothetical protein